MNLYDPNVFFFLIYKKTFFVQHQIFIWQKFQEWKLLMKSFATCYISWATINLGLILSFFLLKILKKIVEMSKSLIDTHIK